MYLGKTTSAPYGSGVPFGSEGEEGKWQVTRADLGGGRTRKKLQVDLVRDRMVHW